MRPANRPKSAEQSPCTSPVHFEDGCHRDAAWGTQQFPELFRISLARQFGRLAQLVRAPALQAGGRRFESCTAHHSSPYAFGLSAMCHRTPEGSLKYSTRIPHGCIAGALHIIPGYFLVNSFCWM